VPLDGRFWVGRGRATAVSRLTFRVDGGAGLVFNFFRFKKKMTYQKNQALVENGVKTDGVPSVLSRNPEDIHRHRHLGTAQSDLMESAWQMGKSYGWYKEMMQWMLEISKWDK